MLSFNKETMGTGKGIPVNKERLAAFTDAVVAIAATIMVLELAVPSENNWHGMMEDLTVLSAYVVSFSQIYLVWKNHHDLFEKAKVISQCMITMTWDNASRIFG